MAGKGSSTRRDGRRGRAFSLKPCATKHMAVEEAAGEEGAFSLRPCATKHMAVTGEEGACATKHMAVTGEEGPFSLRLCATKHMAVEAAVTGGEEGHLKGLPTKRKAADSDYVTVPAGFPNSEALDMFPSPGSVSDEDMLLERLKADLLTFPEAAALGEYQIDLAVEKIIKESNPKTATPTTEGMVRLSDDCISHHFGFSHWAEIPTVHDLAPTGAFPPGWIYDQRKKLDNEVQPHKRKFGRDIGLLLAKIRVDLLTRGYVDVPELYLEDTPDLIAAEKEAKLKGLTGLEGDKWWIQLRQQPTN